MSNPKENPQSEVNIHPDELLYHEGMSMYEQALLRVVRESNLFPVAFREILLGSEVGRDFRREVVARTYELAEPLLQERIEERKKQLYESIILGEAAQTVVEPEPTPIEAVETGEKVRSRRMSAAPHKRSRREEPKPIQEKLELVEYTPPEELKKEKSKRYKSKNVQRVEYSTLSGEVVTLKHRWEVAIAEVLQDGKQHTYEELFDLLGIPTEQRNNNLKSEITRAVNVLSRSGLVEMSSKIDRERAKPVKISTFAWKTDVVEQVEEEELPKITLEGVALVMESILSKASEIQKNFNGVHERFEAPSDPLIKEVQEIEIPKLEDAERSKLLLSTLNEIGKIIAMDVESKSAKNKRAELINRYPEIISRFVQYVVRMAENQRGYLDQPKPSATKVYSHLRSIINPPTIVKYSASNRNVV